MSRNSLLQRMIRKRYFFLRKIKISVFFSHVSYAQTPLLLSDEIENYQSFSNIARAVSRFLRSFSRVRKDERMERDTRKPGAQTTGDKQRRVERFMLSARNTYWGCLAARGLHGFLRRVGSRVKRILFLRHYVIAARVAAGRQTLYRRRGREAESFVFQQTFFQRERKSFSSRRGESTWRDFVLYKGNSIAKFEAKLEVMFERGWEWKILQK